MSGGQKILVVDDTPQNLKLIGVVLQGAGYDVRAAPEAEEALRVLGTFTPALILMDIQLPGMDGIELTQKLKADPAFEHVAIVALTAYAMRGDKEKALAVGFDGYISKPIDIEELPKLVAAHIAAKAERKPPQ